ncbi:MAG: chemotaxis protein CheW [Myxococcaceae bacterium]|nr:chemotaxis protein CheW [Myxococcaceae bacterium]
METTQLCTFKVDDLFFGIEVTQVQEVLRFQPMTRVPLAEERIRGLINLRGQIVTAIDLRASLQLPVRVSDELPMNVVIRSADGCVSFLVDSIGDVIEVKASSFEPPPSTMKVPHRSLIEAVCKLPGQLLLVLAPQRVINHAEARSPARGVVS